MSDITNPPMDDDPNADSSPGGNVGGDVTNPPMDDERDGDAAPGASLENPPA